VTGKIKILLTFVYWNCLTEKFADGRLLLQMVKTRRTTKRSISELSNDLSSNESSSEETEPPKKQKMGENSEVMMELKRQDKCRIQDKRILEDEMRKTNGLINDQKTESREQCNEIKESINNIKVDIIRVEAETKKGIENLRAEMEEKLEEKIAKMQHESALQNIRKKEIIMFKINKSQAEDDVVRKAEDKTEVLKTLNEVYKIDKRDMIFCNRVGKKQSNPTNPRPVIVRLKSEAQRDEVLEAARGKPGIEENLTKEQQAVKRKMLDEMKSKNAEAGHHLYKVVGRSGIFQLVKKRQRKESSTMES
jgi:hypothetical protein